jgi:Uma2 family endonuclease
MARSVKTGATSEDLYLVPEHMVAEILGGELFVSPRPALPHTNAASVLGAELGTAFHLGRGGPGGWWILDEPELHFAADVLVPDLAAWRRERLPAIPPNPYLELAPDWICEILSPATERIDRARKLAIYARENVRHAWLVNPAAHTLEVLRLEAERWTLLATHEGGASVRAEPFDAIELALAALWI